MAWAYCDTCGEKMNYPTAREIVEQIARCSQDHENDPKASLADLIEKMDERIKELENHGTNP